MWKPSSDSMINQRLYDKERVNKEKVEANSYYFVNLTSPST